MKRVDIKKIRKKERIKEFIKRADFAIKASMVFTISLLLITTTFAIVSARASRVAYEKSQKELQRVEQLKQQVSRLERDVEFLKSKTK